MSGEKLNMTASNPASLRHLVARSDSHPALMVPESGAALSYAALQRALDRAVGRLATLGVREGDRVALVAANAYDDLVGSLEDTTRAAEAVERLRLDTASEYDPQVVDALSRLVLPKAA